MARIAITREISPRIGECELTYLERGEINVCAAKAQHLQYEKALEELGCKIIALRAEPRLADSVFVEDTAVVLDEIAVITRPGAESRREETREIARVLQEYRRLAFIEPPGTLDGGDVLRVGKTLYVGCSSRSNKAGIDELAFLIAPFGYGVKPVPLEGCLHLKTAVTQVGPDTLLVNRELVDRDHFEGMDFIAVHPDEPLGGNALLIGETVVYPKSFQRTRKRLEDRGIAVKAVDMSELAKAEGGVTCCSLIFDFDNGMA
jgi:dimethylargininase